ncbi:hypothetical protein TNCV_2227061 [Trichonephila clavipes]|uniref:DUF5641 domain-containing protein n=1 Tax=Trichonephila clavipes TaxID=2585209 RepID=A0A8X7BK88_TRICX|nr:hypothetical protein TNCV_2227061 [Trichonephila clavipes]
MVLVKEDNLPPLQWSLGRVVQVFPGDDGAVRVVDVKTQRGQFRRPITKRKTVAEFRLATVDTAICSNIFIEFMLHRLLSAPSVLEDLDLDHIRHCRAIKCSSLRIP